MHRSLGIMLLAGCGRLGFDPLGTAGGDGVITPDGATGDPVTCAPTVGCPEYSVSVGAGGSTSEGVAVTGDHGFAGSCGGNANPEVSWQLNPLADGAYTVTVTSGPALIYVRDLCCTGPELMCVVTPGSVVIQRQRTHPAVIFVETLQATVSITIDGP